MGFAVAGPIAVPLTGYASQGSPAWLRVAAESLHVIAAACWVGGLIMIALTIITPDRDALAQVLPRFSTLAGTSIAAVAVSGLLLAPSRLHPSGADAVYDALTRTPTGWPVLGNCTGIVLLVASGGTIRQSLLSRHQLDEVLADVRSS
jgi:putative copper resistance protein D